MSEASQEKNDANSKERLKGGIKKLGKPGPLSKKCLGLAIPSDILFGIGFMFGFMSIILAIALYRNNITDPVYYAAIVAWWIFALIMHALGVIFAIVSFYFGKQARESEPKNYHEKIGTIFSIIGIATNATFMSIVIGFLIFTLALTV